MEDLTLADRIKNALFGAVIGAIIGPLTGGLIGFVLLSITWTIQARVWPDVGVPADEIIPLSLSFALLVAPIAISISVLVGALVGGLDMIFQARVSAAAFGGALGVTTGTLASFGLFGGENGNIIAIVVGILTFAFTGAVAGAVIKYFQLRQQGAGSRK
jgi:hypothetical protein